MNHEQIKKDVLARLAIYALANAYEVTLVPFLADNLSSTSSWKLMLKKKTSITDHIDFFSFVGKRLMYKGAEYECRQIPTWSKGRFKLFCSTGPKKGTWYSMSLGMWKKRKHEFY